MSRRKGPKKQVSKRSRDGYLRKTYGITEAEYTKLDQEEYGCCWICGAAPKVGRKLNVDHDHKLAKTDGVRKSVRGLLCFYCNKRVVGRNRKEHAWRYLKAAAYLTSDKAQQILGGT